MHEKDLAVDQEKSQAVGVDESTMVQAAAAHQWASWCGPVWHIGKLMIGSDRLSIVGDGRVYESRWALEI